IKTPEQTVPGITMDEPWESCITMGTQWAYKPTNEDYKTGARLIELLIETRAKGGNLLLNVGPKPNGELPEQQTENLREIAAWNFINREAVEEVSPWILPKENNIWFTWKPEEKIVYAFLSKIPDWERGARKEFVIKSVQITPNSEVSVLGQSGELVEYQPNTNATTRFEQKEDGLHISGVRAQRIYNNHKWHNPLVLKITHVEPALEPPVVVTQTSDKNNNELIFSGKLIKTGNVPHVKVGFEYREYAGFVEELYSDEWHETQTRTLSEPGEFEIPVETMKQGKTYQYRAFVEHPKIRVYGDIQRVNY
ncbi:MAG TPA: alpha-L-fucosidase, partial [Prolixibacteraceae bacterium]|nr:alpha-L-fucosidase [Prolixibacteraceae bacterium]